MHPIQSYLFERLLILHDDRVSFTEVYLFIFRLENVPDGAELGRLHHLVKPVELKKQDFERNYVVSTEPRYTVSLSFSWLLRFPF
jgi:hypothetical protein